MLMPWVIPTRSSVSSATAGRVIAAARPSASRMKSPAGAGGRSRANRLATSWMSEPVGGAENASSVLPGLSNCIGHPLDSKEWISGCSGGVMPRKCANCGLALAEEGPASLALCATCARPVCSYACRVTHEDRCLRRQPDSDTSSSNEGDSRGKGGGAPSLFDLAWDRVEHPLGGIHDGGLEAASTLP